MVDGISSQRPLDRSVGLVRMQELGAHIISAEGAMFMLLRDKATPAPTTPHALPTPHLILQAAHTHRVQ